MEFIVKKGVLVRTEGRPENGIVAIPLNVKEIADEVFCNCSGLKHVILPDSLQKIGKEAFSGNYTLQKVTFRRGNSRRRQKPLVIGENAFGFCRSLETMDLPAHTERIGAYAFQRCWRLRRLAPEGHPEDGIYLPEGVRSIGTEAFESCEKIPSLHLPSTLCTFGKNAIQDCHGLHTITWQREKLYRFPVYETYDTSDVPEVLFYGNFRSAFYSEPSLCMVAVMLVNEFRTAETAEFLATQLPEILFRPYDGGRDYLGLDGLRVLCKAGLLEEVLTKGRIAEKLSPADFERLLKLFMTDRFLTRDGAGVPDALLECDLLAGKLTEEVMDELILLANTRQAYGVQMALMEAKKKLYSMDAGDILKRFAL